MTDAPTSDIPNGDPATAQVAILLGSNSDLPVMKKCVIQLEKLGVAYDVVVASALRVLRLEWGRPQACPCRTRSKDIVTSRSSGTDGRTVSLVTFERYRPVVLFGLRSRCYLAVSFVRLTPPGSGELERGFDSRSMRRGG